MLSTLFGESKRAPVSDQKEQKSPDKAKDPTTDCPIFPDCWETSRIPLTEDTALKSVLVLPEKNSVIGVVTDKVGGLYLMNYTLGEEKSQLTLVRSGSDPIQHCLISRQYLIAVDASNTIDIWDLNGVKVNTLLCASPILAIAFFDHDKLAHLTKTTVHTWDFKKNETRECAVPPVEVFTTLTVTKNQKILLSGIGTCQEFTETKGSVEAGRNLPGQFVCETEDSLVTFDPCPGKDHYALNSYDKSTFAVRNVLKLPISEKHEVDPCPVAIKLPMGWIHCILTIPRGDRFRKEYQRTSIILNTLLQPIATRTLSSSELVSFSDAPVSTFLPSHLASTQPNIPVFFAHDGACRGNLQNHCLRWQQDPLRNKEKALVEAHIFPPLARIVMDYCGSGDQDLSYRLPPLSRTSLRSFVMTLNHWLHDQGNFPTLEDIPSSMPFFKPQLHPLVVVKTNLINKLENLLFIDDMRRQSFKPEDVAADASSLVDMINLFEKAIRNSKFCAKQTYEESLIAFLHEEMFTLSDHFPSLNVEKLCYIIQHMINTHFIPAVGGEQKEEKSGEWVDTLSTCAANFYASCGFSEHSLEKHSKDELITLLPSVSEQPLSDLKQFVLISLNQWKKAAMPTRFEHMDNVLGLPPGTVTELRPITLSQLDHMVGKELEKIRQLSESSLHRAAAGSRL